MKKMLSDVVTCEVNFVRSLPKEALTAASNLHGGRFANL